jgi:uncharacterized protein YprB with RNaseH-like and TPR domain
VAPGSRAPQNAAYATNDPGSAECADREADPASVLGGEWREAPGHPFVVVDRTYRPGHRHGHTAIADALPPVEGCWPELSLLAGGPCTGRALFVDLETTGLAGGAGTYAFLVGCAWFESGVLRIRQFFLSSFAAERALLEAVCDLAGECTVVVTYNGKTFDLPLIETRFLLHRLETPFARMPHVDMLHPARRMWRPDDDRIDGGSCRLTHVEQLLCGHLREGDVPGFEIPSRYFQYVRSGDARPLEGVLEHNRLDLISLALVTARAAQLVEGGATVARTAREALGLGRLYERSGAMDRARACFARAAGLAPDPLDADAVMRAEALRAYAVLLRRERRHAEAAAAWQQIVALRQSPAHILREAAEALAIHHEHRLRDPRTARGFAMRSLQLHDSTVRARALQHRLARLDRKLGTPAADASALF